MQKDDLIKNLKDLEQRFLEIDHPNINICRDAVLMTIHRLKKSKYRDSHSVIYDLINSQASVLNSNYTNNNYINSIKELLSLSASLVPPLTSKNISSVENEADSILISLKESQIKYDKEIQAYISESKNNRDQSDDALSELLDSKSNAEKEIGKVLEMVKAGVYTATANQEFRKSKTMRWWAISCFIFASLTALFFIILSITKNISIVGTEVTIALNDISFLSVISKLLGSAILALPGFYLAKESAKHYKEAVRSQRIAHELGSLDNYFVDFKDEELRAQIKAILALRYFGNADSIYSTDDDAMPSEDLTKTIAGMVSQLAKKSEE